MKIIVVANQKGGVGKTSTCHALGVGLANRGNRVLFVDTDSQCNLCDACEIDTEDTTDTLYSVFRGEIPIQKAVQPISTSGIDIVRGDLLFSRADSEFLSIGRERLLQKALKPLQSVYDFAVVDTSPTLGIMTANALAAADYVLIPSTPGRFSVKGLRQLGQFIDQIKEDRNPNLQILGILVNRYTERFTANRLLLEEIETAAEELGTVVFKSKIRQSVAMDEAQIMQTDIFSGKSPIAKDFDSFVSEFIERIK